MKYTLSLLAFCIFTSHQASSLNRIKAPTDPAKRCMDQGTSQQKCEDMRSNALRINCITITEYNTLKRFGSYPTCNVLRGEGLDMLDGWCSCGCFHPQTLLKVFDNKKEKITEVTASEIVQNKNHLQLLHLSSNATMSSFDSSHSPIRLTTLGKEHRRLYVFVTESKAKLMVTSKHPILTSTGTMKQAQNITKQDRLIDSNGEEVLIKEIIRMKYRDTVINFSTEAENNLEHIIFANDLAVGDLYWQASLEDHYNRIMIRS